MAETNGLLNRRTSQGVPGVRIPPSPQKGYSSGCSAARLAHLVWDQRVAGSNPATPTKEKGTETFPFFISIFRRVQEPFIR